MTKAPATNGHAGNGKIRIRRPATYGRRTGDETSRDPGAASPVTAPNLGRYMIPQIVTHQGRLSTVADVYRNPDEAILNSIDNARMMRKDLVIEECLEGRKLATALLGWHLDPDEDDKDDPDAIELVTKLTKIVKRIPRFMMYRFSIMDAIWQGRQANQHRYAIERSRRDGKRVIIDDWKPLHGDKLAFRFDDGTGRHRDNEVGIRVGTTYNLGDTIAGGRKVEITEYGPAYFLEPWERRMLAVHRHIIEDGFYEDPISAGRIHGVGIRDRVYWTWFQKQNALAQLMEVVERTGQGFYVYYFPAGNKQAHDEMQKVAEEQTHSNYVLMPRNEGDPSLDAYGIDVIPPNTAGIEALRSIIHEFFGHQIKRYILGQTLTSEAQATGLGSNVADMHYESLMRIRDFDAINLEETLTTELIDPLKEYNFGAAAREIPIRFKVDTDSTESDKKLEAAYKAWEMGAELPTKYIFELCGCPEPTEGEKTLSNPQMQQQQRLWAQAGPMNVQDLFGPLADRAEQPEPAQPPGKYSKRRPNKSLAWVEA